jgi:hypothetical protein
VGAPRLRAFVAKNLDEMWPQLNFDSNPYIALIIDLNQTPGSFDLAMIARSRLLRYHGPGIRIPI